MSLAELDFFAYTHGPREGRDAFPKALLAALAADGAAVLTDHFVNLGDVGRMGRSTSGVLAMRALDALGPGVFTMGGPGDPVPPGTQWSPAATEAIASLRERLWLVAWVCLQALAEAKLPAAQRMAWADRVDRERGRLTFYPRTPDPLAVDPPEAALVVWAQGDGIEVRRGDGWQHAHANCRDGAPRRLVITLGAQAPAMEALGFDTIPAVQIAPPPFPTPDVLGAIAYHAVFP